jgi:hypothetical protein
VPEQVDRTGYPVGADGAVAELFAEVGPEHEGDCGVEVAAQPSGGDVVLDEIGQGGGVGGEQVADQRGERGFAVVQQAATPPRPRTSPRMVCT